MTAKALGYERLPALSIAVGATTPDPGVAGVMAWSIFPGAAKLLVWTGSSWELPGLVLSTTDPADIAAVAAVGVGTTAARADHVHELGQYDWDRHEVFIARPAPGTTAAPIGIGVVYLSQGATGSGQLVNDGVLLNLRPRVQRQTNTIAASLAELYTSGRFLLGYSGYRYVKEFGITPSTNCRWFGGLLGSITGLTNVAMNSLTDCIGIGRHDGSGNTHLFHNDASGTCTVIDLGTNFPANSGTNLLYRLTLVVPPGAANYIYLVERPGTAFTASGTISTNMPAQDVQLGERLFATNHTDAINVTVMFCKMTAFTTIA